MSRHQERFIPSSNYSEPAETADRLLVELRELLGQLERARALLRIARENSQTSDDEIDHHRQAIAMLLDAIASVRLMIVVHRKIDQVYDQILQQVSTHPSN